MSRCTPSRETSGPLERPFSAILSNSSMKTMPDSSVASMALSTMMSMSRHFSNSSSLKISRALATFIFFFFFFFGMMLPSISWKLLVSSSVELPVRMPWKPWFCSATSTSISRSSILWAQMSSNIFCRRSDFGSSSCFGSSGVSSSSSSLLKKTSIGFLTFSLMDFFGQKTWRMRLLASSSAFSS